ncbi:MAG: insulinase family protein [Planctomycetes bacterium]|nr:insulinase family protein [Planctomycetota bacterium]
MKRFCKPHQGAVALVSLFCLFFLVAAPAFAQLPAGLKKVRTIEGVTEYRLDNGLRLLLYPDPSASRVTVNMTVLAGSRHEGYGETGMAHLLEHMLFKGTKNLRDVPKALRDHGADSNATTWVDRTNYFETLPASDRNLEFAISLEADRLVNSLILREDLAKEMTVVRNEFEQNENNPETILSQRMVAVAYEWHNYGKTTMGNRSDIERVPVDRLQEFYRWHYQPDNVVLIVGGKFDEPKALGWVAKYFGPLKKPARRLAATYTEEPAQDGEREVVLRRVGNVGTVGAVYHIAAAAHQDFPACEVLANLLDYEPGGRLHKALVLTKKATNVGTGAFGYHDPGILEVIVQTGKTDEQSIRGVRDAMVEVLEKLPGETFTKEEVERVKLKLLKEREQLMSDAKSVTLELSEWIAKGDWRLFFLHRDRLKKITPDDVARVAERYLKRSNRTSGLYLPTEKVTRANIPEAPKLEELLQGYKGGGMVAAGEAFDPTLENLEKRTRRVELPSGVKTALLPKKTRAEAVAAQLSLRFGNEQSLKGRMTAAECLGSMLRRGTRDMTRQQLDDALDKLEAEVQLRSDAGELRVTILCKRKALPKVLRLLQKMLREPSFPADEFDVLKRQKLENLQDALGEPAALANRALRRAAYPYDKGDVRYTPTIEEEIELVKALTLDTVRGLYTEQLGGQHGELAIVGDFDAEEAVKLAGDALKDWKNGTPYQRIERKAFPHVKGREITIDTPDKENAIYLAAETFLLKDSDPDYPALQLGNYLFGGPEARLWKRLREEEGLSYRAGSTLTGGLLSPTGEFYTYGQCAPPGMRKLEKAVKEELERFLKDGAQKQELEDGIKAFLLGRKNARGSDVELVSVLVSNLQAGRTFVFQAEIEKKVAALTPEQVRAAFRKYIDPKRLVIVRAGDFKKPQQ